MPKAKKTAKAAKGSANADFKKTKVKLGKKIAPANQTNVEFKAKAISMQKQKAIDEKSGITTNRKLTMDDLYLQLKHYRAQSRRDAVLGLKELLVKHPSLAVLSLRDLIEKTFPLANDEDRSVRRTLSTFVEALLPLCPRGAMEPFLPLVVTYVSQSLTHLDEKVRMDTLPVVNALVGYLGGCHATGALGKLLPSMLALLHSSQDTAGSSKNVQLCNPKARSAILRSLVGLCSPSVGTEESSSQGTRDPQRAHKSQLGLARDAARMPYLASLAEVGQAKGGAEAAGSTLASGEFLSEVAPGLFGLWTECASNEQPSEEEGVVLALVLELLAVLLEGLGEAGSVLTRLVGDLENHVMAHFPFQRIASDAERWGLNVKACQVMSHFLPPCDAAATEAVTPTWVSGVYGFLLECLRGKVHMDATALPPEEIFRLLETLGRFLHQLPLAQVEEGFQATLALSQRCHALSRPRQVCLEFVSRWLLERDRTDKPSVNPDLLRRWLQSLPKALWELKADHPGTSRTVLLTLIEVGRRGRAADLFNSIQPTMVPFFFTTIGGKKAPRQLYGPFLSLPEELQRRALDTVSYFASPSLAMLRALAACCAEPSLAPGVARYGVSVVHGLRHRLQPARYISFMLSVMLSETVQPEIQIHVAKTLASLRAGATLGGLVAPILEGLLRQPKPAPRRVLTGLARCVAVCAGSAAGQEGSPFPASLEALLGGLLWQAWWGQYRDTVARGAPEEKGRDSMQAAVASALQARPELAPLLLVQVEATVRSSHDAEEAAILLTGLLRELPKVVQRDPAPTWALVRRIEEVAGAMPSASEQAGRLRAVLEHQSRVLQALG